MRRIFITCLIVVGLALSHGTQDALGALTVRDDFNGDGYADLAVATPDESGSRERMGAVSVFYGTAVGLSATGNQFWSRDNGDLLGGPGGHFQFGLSLAAGDFNADGRADLAIGTPFDYVGSVVWAGSVSVLYGTADGLSAAGNQRWTQDSPGVPGVAEIDDEFGWSLAVGDFNGDHFADLAVGASWETVGGAETAGALNVLYGGDGGLSATGSEYWDQDNPEIPDGPEWRDVFASALAAGDFNGDRRDDLAVGVPGEDVGDIENGGVVHVLHGTHAGLSARRGQLWNQDSPGMLDSVEPNEGFGTTLAAADFNRDRRVDLAVDLSGEAFGNHFSGGAVSILYGALRGLSARRNQLWHQGSDGLLDDSEDGDQFGVTLAAGDFNGDLRPDLAAGAPCEWIGTVTEVRCAGAVSVIYSDAGGLSATGNQFWHQESVIPLEDEEFDYFGQALTAGDFNGDGSADLTVGIPGEDLGLFADFPDAGAVSVFYGAAGGLSTSGHQDWTQDSPGVLDEVEADDKFGRVLAADHSR